VSSKDADKHVRRFLEDPNRQEALSWLRGQGEGEQRTLGVSRSGLLVIGVASAMAVAGRAFQVSMAQLRMQIAVRPSPFI